MCQRQCKRKESSSIFFCQHASSSLNAGSDTKQKNALENIPHSNTSRRLSEIDQVKLLPPKLQSSLHSSMFSNATCNRPESEENKQTDRPAGEKMQFSSFFLTAGVVFVAFEGRWRVRSHKNLSFYWKLGKLHEKFRTKENFQASIWAKIDEKSDPHCHYSSPPQRKHKVRW